jgi:hypothetical protein
MVNNRFGLFIFIHLLFELILWEKKHFSQKLVCVMLVVIGEDVQGNIFFKS